MGKSFSAHSHLFQHANYTDVKGMWEHGYMCMPQIKETLDSYLSMGEASTFKALSLPTKLLSVTPRLNGIAYAAAV